MTKTTSPRAPRKSALTAAPVEMIQNAVAELEAQPVELVASVDVADTFIEAQQVAEIEAQQVSKVTAQALKTVFHGYDAGTRTKALRKFASEKTLETAVIANFMSDAQFDALQKHASLPTGKVAMMQIAKAADFIASGDVGSIDKAVAAFCVISYLVEHTDSNTFENARFTLSAKGNDNSRPINGINASGLRKSIGAIRNVSTVSAQTSRCVGKNGILGIMGATVKDSAHTFKVNPGSKVNPFVLAYCKALSKLPEGTLVAALNGADEE